MKVNPGGDPSIYISMKEELISADGDIVGHLMMDEIKLNNGISFNCKSNEITGFVEQQLKTKVMFENILSITKKKKQVLKLLYPFVGFDYHSCN